MAHKYVVKISCSNETDAMKLGCQLHNQLVGNPDHAKGNIILASMNAYNNVFLFINDVDEVPEITLFKKENK